MFQWTHSDTRGVDVAAAQAISRSQIKAWGVDGISQSDADRQSDFLALIADSLLVRQELIDASSPSLITQLLSPTQGAIGFHVQQATAPDVDHVNAQIILLRTWEVLARNAGWQDTDAAMLSAKTYGDRRTQSAVPAILIVVVVIEVLAVAGIVAYLIYNSANVIDRELARNAQAQELMRAHADAQAMLQKHADAERAAGHPIPFSQPELLIMAKLAQLQDAAMHGFSATLAHPLNPNAPTQISDVAERVLTLAVVLGFVYFLIRREI